MQQRDMEIAHRADTLRGTEADVIVAAIDFPSAPFHALHLSR